MPKFMVAVTEIVEYLVPVEAANEELAGEIGEERITESADRDKWVVACRAREVEGCNPVETFEPDRMSRLDHVRAALSLARSAREHLRAAKAKQAASYVQRALKSVEGAERHAIRMEGEALRGQNFMWHSADLD